MPTNLAAMLRTCLLLLLCIAGSRQLSITEFAVPSAVEAGRNAELQCHTESERVEYVKWWWTPLYVPLDDRDKIQLYQRMPGQPAELLVKNVEIKENDTIVLLNLKSTDSGIYECEVSVAGATEEARKHQDLIVFSNGTDLQLNVSKIEDGPDEDEDEDVLVLCEAHDVTPQPELSIFVNGEEVANVTQYVSGGEHGLYDVYVNATLSDDDAEDAEIRCELFFENRNISHPPYEEKIIYTTDGVDGLRACLWILNIAAIVQLYSYSVLNS
ncbi:hypothetical protein ABMA28_002091 [Loxostege sticticalis]|uniref:Ig-like domain-containing protein n=1 Tax=Loxostege sticticalis TaxID=481309 RepID=A0ABD0SZV9_LOXSC